MKTLHLIPFLWSGAGNVVSKLAVSQKASGEVGVVTSEASKGESDWAVYRRRLRQNGVDHFRIDLFDRSSDVFWRSVSEFGKLIDRYRPEVVHCHSGVPAAVAATVRDGGRRTFRLVGQLHSWGHGRPEWMDAMDLWALGRCDSVISNASDYRSRLLESGIPADRIVSIPWGLPLDEIDGQNRRPPRPGRCPRLGFVGRIEPRKRQLDLVRVFERLRRRRPDARLELVGPVADRQYAARIRARIESLHAGNRLSMAGRVPNVYRRVRDWDLFVSLSSDEGQGMAILEAMALGVPVVSADVAGVRDYLEHGRNGMLVDSTRLASVAGTVLWALDHPAETARMAAEARRIVDREYRWETTVERTEALYRGAAR